MRSPAPLAALAVLVVGFASAGLGAGPTRVNLRESVDRESVDQAVDQSMHRPLDEVLDLYVRDGFVYYKALKSDRAKLDRYLASLAAVNPEGWPRERQIAFWLDAYNGFVLQTIVSNYPIHGRSSAYPSDSIRQIPGAFDRTAHRVGGRSLTLDAIENTIVAGFKDPRLYFALGRGAVGSGRLRSEAFEAARLEAQVKEVAAEVVTRPVLFSVDRAAATIRLSPLFGWHEADFVAAYAAGADPRFASRSPMERAVIAFAVPNLLPDEVDFVNQNTFKVVYSTFDWSLNDLATRR